MPRLPLTGTLYVVATPIGNLSDVSARALEVLRSVDIVTCEDTRTTRTLLARHGIVTSTTALHQHNEQAAAAKLIDALRAGKTVALVSDAGTPALSDPGALLVAQAHRARIRVSPVPGPSAAAAALSVAGFPAGAFFFAGFLPASPAARQKALERLDLEVPLVLYEAPHRIAGTLEALAAHFGAAREVLVGRELTKKFEEVARMPLGEASAWLAASPERSRGEFVLVLAPGERRRERVAPDPDKVLAILASALSPSEAARLAARITGEPKRELYRKALRLPK
ncbi:MAG TPA: 16S rRNA (cytidine(1402)-2'-O)-methyltransferase [Burkholderiales bacterium]|nr:16S rRNA (cytidine(1402)-2'-O)-methyltransferase [Burkholderiales bacterium]